MCSWPFNLCSRPDELLSSWLIRHAIANGSDPSSFAGAIWPNWRAWTVDFDRAIRQDKLQKLADASGVGVVELNNMTLQPTIEYVLHTQDLPLSKAWTWVIPTGNRNRTRTNGLHFCAHCLKGNPIYFKKSWRIAWNVGCSKHHSLLCSNCPKCDTTISPHLVTYKRNNISRCIICGYDLSKTPQQECLSEALWLQEILNRSLSSKFDETVPIGAKGYDLFSITHFFMAFFLDSIRPLKPFSLLHKKLDISPSNLRRSPQTGVSIEARTAFERQHLMVATARLLRMSLAELIELFQRTGISQQMFMIHHTESSLLLKIHRHLADNSKQHYTVPIRVRPFQPRTKVEVDAMMSELLPYIK